MSKYRILPVGGGGIVPSGTLEIRSEGTFDVTDYASVDVDIFDDTTTKTVTDNGIYNAEDDHVLGYSQVTVQVPASAVDSGTLTIEPITQNVNLFTQDVTGYRAIAFEVAVPASAVDSGTKQITSNGNGQDVVGYAAVDVAVPASAVVSGTKPITQNGTGIDVTDYQYVDVNVQPQQNTNYLCFEATQSTNITLTSNNSNYYPTIYYSTDNKQTWTQMTSSTSIPLSVGEKVYFYGDNPNGFSFSTSFYSYFAGDFNVSGDVKTLISNRQISNIPSGAFAYLFRDSGVVDASSLDLSGELSYSTFFGMFNGCTALTAAPTLPATISINSYGSMFNGCTSLVTPPDMSNLTIEYANGLSYMFKNCTALTTPPDLSGLTSVGNSGLAYTFTGCTSLTSGPDLSSLTSVGNYGLQCTFEGCTALTTPPDLSSLTSVGNSGGQNMFHDCSSLTAAPDLSSLTSVGDKGLQGFVWNCYKIASLTAPNILELRTAYTNILTNWASTAGTQATGTKICRVPTGANIETGSQSGIPSGFYRVNY